MQAAVSSIQDDDDLDIREAARRQALRDGLTLGAWLDRVMADHANALGIALSDLDPHRRVEAVMLRLGRSGRQARAAATRATIKPRAGTAGHDRRELSGGETGQAAVSGGEWATGDLDLTPAAIEEWAMESDKPALRGTERTMGVPQTALDLGSYMVEPGVPGQDEAPRPDKVMTATSRQAAQRVEIEAKLTALFRALDKTPRRADSAAAPAHGDAPAGRVQSLLNETAISPTWRLEKAIGEIAERQAFLERQASGDDSPAPPKPTHPRAAAEALRRKIEQPATAADAIGKVQSAQAMTGQNIPSIFTALQGDIAQLAKRLETVSHDISARPAPEPAPATTFPFDAIRTLIGEMRPDESIETLGRSVEALSTKLDKMNENRVPADAIARLSQRIEDVHAEVTARLSEQAAAPAVDMQAIEQLIRELVDRADRPAATTPDLRGLEGAVHDLARKLDQVERSQGGVDALADLQAQVGSLAERIDRSDAGLNAIVAMERSLGDIFAQMGDMREAAMQAAEAAARDAAHETVRAAVAEVQQAVAPAGAVNDAAVQQVTQELVDLRTHRAESDKRLHAILAALNISLERVVERLGALETDVAETREITTKGRDLPAQTTIAAPMATAPIDLATPPEAVVEPPAIVVSAPPAVARGAGEPVDLDVPIEPGSAMRARIPNVEGLGGSTPGAPDPSGFIAAARRAAQTASAEQGLKVDAPLGGRLSGPAVDGKPARIKTGMLSRRRPLLLALASLLVLAGAAQIARLTLANGETGVETTATTPQPAPKTPGPKADAGDAATTDGAAEVEKVVAAVKAGTVPVVEAPSVTDAAPVVASAAPVPADVIAKTDPVAAGKVPLPTMAMGPAANIAAVQAADLAARAAAIGGIPVRLQSLADSGDAPAQYEIGLRYADGRGVTRDVAKAAGWFEKAAKQGLAPAAYRLGSLYEKGLGVQRDAAASVDWYQQAAKAGNIRAMHNLAVMLAEGANGKSDYPAAASWFTKAAEAGVRDSQYNLAILYARGMGVEQNLARSYTWFSIAAAQGDVDSDKKRADVAAHLDAKALEEAKQAAEAFKPAPSLAAANDVTAPAGGWDGTVTPRPMSSSGPSAKAAARMGQL